MSCPDFNRSFYDSHTRRLCYSYQHWTGKELLYGLKTSDDPLLVLFEAPFVIVSHGTEKIPVFNFGNRMALELFELSWEKFIQLPSKHSADDENQLDRAELMARVSKYGFAKNCTGTRISSNGKRFFIEGATVWNVIDENGRYYGQAAMFDTWAYI